MITLDSTSKTVTVQREFAGIEAYEDGKRLRVAYREITTIDDQVIKDEVKTYDRNYEFWKASEIGQAIIGMIELDLQQQDPSAPREVPA